MAESSYARSFPTTLAHEEVLQAKGARRRRTGSCRDADDLDIGVILATISPDPHHASALQLAVALLWNRTQSRATAERSPSSVAIKLPSKVGPSV